MNLNFKTIFLIDAVGAFLSAGIIGVVLPKFVEWIGLPIETLYLLAAIALIYAVYSFFCYWVVRPAKYFLAAIMIANLLYCALTASIIAIHRNEVSGLGLFYFAGEILIILLLVAIERNVFRKMVD